MDASISADPNSWHDSSEYVEDEQLREPPKYDLSLKLAEKLTFTPTTHNHQPATISSPNPSDANHGPPSGTDAPETQENSVEDDDMTYDFWQDCGDQRVLHRIHLQLIGSSTAGVYRAQARPKDHQTPEPLFCNGKPFVLKLFNIEAAEEIQSQVGIDFSELPDKTITEYLNMTRDGRLQEYVDSLAEEVEISTLPAEIAELFERGKTIKAQIVRYALDVECYEGDGNLIEICQEAGLLHEEQDTEVYRLAFAMFWITCTRHKEFAVHLLLDQHLNKDHSIVPSMIAFLKLDTKSKFFNSMTTDALAMEMFEGAALYKIGNNPEAKEVFGRMCHDELRVCLQDVVGLGSCLLPLGLQQRDAAARNIFMRFNTKYRTSSWIDLESVHPVRGDTAARENLERQVAALLKQEDNHEGKHFRVPLQAMSLHLDFVDPDFELERDLHEMVQSELRYCLPEIQVRQFIQNCNTTSYETRKYRLFSGDLVTTTIYWSLVQSACKAFIKNPHLVTTYLQILRYTMEYHLAQNGTSSFRWMQATYDSISRLHFTLGFERGVRSTPAWREMVTPFICCGMLVDRLHTEAGNNFKLESNDNYPSLLDAQGFLQRSQICDSLLTEDLVQEQPRIAKMYRKLAALAEAAGVCDIKAVDKLQRVEGGTDVIDFLTRVGRGMAESLSLFEAMEDIPATMSRVDFVKIVKIATQHEPALEEWRAGVCLQASSPLV